MLIAQSPAIELHLLLFQQWNTPPYYYTMSTRDQIKHLAYHILNKMSWVASDVCLWLFMTLDSTVLFQVNIHERKKCYPHTHNGCIRYIVFGMKSTNIDIDSLPFKNGLNCFPSVIHTFFFSICMTLMTIENKTDSRI